MLVKATTHPKPATYTVAFNSNGGSAVPRQRVKKGDKATEPTDPTKANNTFDGWYSDAGLTTEYDFDAVVSKNMVLYAKWEPIPVTVTIQNTDATYTATVTATPLEGAAETYTLTPGGSQVLAEEFEAGDTIGTNYSSISVAFNDSETTTFTIDTTIVLTQGIVIEYNAESHSESEDPGATGGKIEITPFPTPNP